MKATVKFRLLDEELMKLVHLECETGMNRSEILRELVNSAVTQTVTVIRPVVMSPIGKNKSAVVVPGGTDSALSVTHNR